MRPPRPVPARMPAGWGSQSKGPTSTRARSSLLSMRRHPLWARRVKNVGKALAEEIVARRGDRPYGSIEEFCAGWRAPPEPPGA